MKLIDANILLYVINQDSAHHAKLLPWWETQLNGDESIGLPWLSLLAFIRISTNPRIFPKPLEPLTAMQVVDTWLQHPLLEVISESENHWEIIRALIVESGTGGNLTSDAHLAALAIAHGAVLTSCDGDFSRFAGLRWENPLAN